jgi:hypothetical protein
VPPGVFGSGLFRMDAGDDPVRGPAVRDKEFRPPAIVSRLRDAFDVDMQPSRFMHHEERRSAEGWMMIRDGSAGPAFGSPGAGVQSQT